MLVSAGIAAGGLVLLVVLILLFWRERRESRRLHARLVTRSAELENLQRSFSRFAPHDVIERAISQGVSTEGERKEVTALFADIVGYTELSERLEPRVLVRVLNGYFERMSDAIAERRGHVSTFLGDGILALFGALEPNPWQSNDAANAALRMRESLAEYSRELSAQGLPALRIGVGLHRGAGVVGLVGSKELMEFAFVGRTVNVAARVQELTRQYPADVIATETVRMHLDPRFALRELPATRVKGVAEPLTIYAVDGF